MIELRAGRASCVVDEESGARLARLMIDGCPMLVEHDDDGLGWGCYPMVPYAGRVRQGRLRFDGREHDLPLRLPPHAIHGTVCEKTWRIDEVLDDRCRLSTELRPGWPFAGDVVHHVHIDPDRLVMRLTVVAAERMPVQIGWHPWFRKPSSRRFGFDAMYTRDAEGITRPDPIRPATIGPDGTNDDCFVDPDRILRIDVADRVLELESSCRHWVIYDHPESATCVEPQSGPPNGINDDPFVLESGASLTHEFVISWTGSDQPGPK